MVLEPDKVREIIAREEEAAEAAKAAARPTDDALWRPTGPIYDEDDLLDTPSFGQAGNPASVVGLTRTKMAAPTARAYAYDDYLPDGFMHPAAKFEMYGFGQEKVLKADNSGIMWTGFEMQRVDDTGSGENRAHMLRRRDGLCVYLVASRSGSLMPLPEFYLRGESFELMSPKEALSDGLNGNWTFSKLIERVDEFFPESVDFGQNSGNDVLENSVRAMTDYCTNRLKHGQHPNVKIEPYGDYIAPDSKRAAKGFTLGIDFDDGTGMGLDVHATPNLHGIYILLQEEADKKLLMWALESNLGPNSQVLQDIKNANLILEKLAFFDNIGGQQKSLQINDFQLSCAISDPEELAGINAAVTNFIDWQLKRATGPVNQVARAA